MSQLVVGFVSMQEIVDLALQILREHSPVGSTDDTHPGLYRDSHMVFIDGHNVPSAAGWRSGQQVNISNPVPYARKIEVGPMKLSVPNHVYETSAQQLASRVGNMMSVKFTYMPVQFGSVAAYAQSREAHAFKHRRAKALRDWLVSQPSIQITAR